MTGDSDVEADVQRLSACPGEVQSRLVKRASTKFWHFSSRIRVELLVSWILESRLDVCWLEYTCWRFAVEVATVECTRESCTGS